MTRCDYPFSMAIDTKKYRLRVHRQTLRFFGTPSYVLLLFSAKKNAIVVLMRDRKVPNGQEIPVVFDKPGNAGTFDIYCKELITRIRKEYGGLDERSLYRLKGYFIQDDAAVCFPLSTLCQTEDIHV